jgi:hypothetical protein
VNLKTRSGSLSEAQRANQPPIPMETSNSTQYLPRLAQCGTNPDRTGIAPEAKQQLRAWHLNILWIAAIAVFLINVPFGFWRSRVRKFSLQWILAIHMPVPLVVACRLLLGIGWHFVTFPVLITAFFAGQFAGGRLQRFLQS